MEYEMQDYQPAIFWREDTLFGVCEALGEDLGFNPLWPRIALALGLLWDPLAMIYAYLGLAVIVLATRLIFPNPRAAVRPEAEAEAEQEAPAADAMDQYPLPIAA
jgi:phage shock protein C